MTGKKNLESGDSLFPNDSSGSHELVSSKSEHLEKEKSTEEEYDDSWFRPDRAPPPRRGGDSDYQFKNEGRHKLIMAASLIVVSLFIAVLWYLYAQQHKPKVIPLFVAETAPVKIVPDNPGGMPIENLERTIYDTVSGEPKKLADKVQPGPETPIELPKNVVPEQKLKNSAQKKSSPSKESQFFKVPDTSSTTRDSFVVQLGAFRSRESAEQAWDRIKKKYQNNLTPYEHDIQSTTTPDGTIIHRLRIGYFSTRAAADTLCKKLKAQGQECLSSGR